MIKEYLNNRKEILEEKLKSNREKYEHNQISIVESNNKIKELENMVDEASEIFSVKAREDSGFNRHEIKELEIRIAAYVSENNDINTKIETIEKELSVIRECIKEVSLYNVSRETLYVNEEKVINECKKEIADTAGTDNLEILNKLIFCKNIAEIDGKRVSVELDNIIKMINLD